MPPIALSMPDWPVLLCISLVLLYIPVHYLIVYPYYLSPLRHVPGPSALTWSLKTLLVGNFPEIILGEAGIPQRAWVKKYGPVVRAIGPVGIERLIFCRPEALHKILASDWTEYPRPGFMREVLGLAAGYGLLTVTGNEHRQMRKVLNPAFSLPNLSAQTDMYYDSINALIKVLNKELEDDKKSKGKVMKVFDWMAKVTLDIICSTAFGYETNSINDPHNELAEYYELLTSLQTGPNIARYIAVVSIPGVAKLFRSDLAYHYRHLLSFLPNMPEFLDAMYHIRNVSRQILNDRVIESAGLVDDRQAKKDIMSILVRARAAETAAAEKGGDATGYRMSDEMLMNQVLTFLGAGHETTASGLSWALILLAQHPEVQEKLRQEVKKAFRPANDGDEIPRPDQRALKELSYLDAVIMESFRLYPPVPMTFRQAAKSDYVDGVFVPKGTLLYIPIRVVNTWEGLWGPDAEEFKPERWFNLPENHNPNLSFLTFIAGPHACIGKTMSIMESKAILGALIANFSFGLAYEGQKQEPTAAVTMRPKDNLPLRVSKVPA